MLLSAVVVVVSTSLLCPHKDGMGPRMSDPLQAAVGHLRRGMRRLVEQYVIHCSRESNESSGAVREKVDF